MNRSRIEGLLASFPKLISAGQQHTFVETENVRYVYQPIEDLYLILITNKASNILLDIDTLHLLARVIPEYCCEKASEKEVRKFAFELLFAFDEIIHLGYRENVNLQQLKTLIEMESHEEKIQEALAKMKEREAKENAKLRIKQMEIQKREMQRKSAAGSVANSSTSFNPSSFGSSASSSYVPAEPKYDSNTSYKGSVSSSSFGAGAGANTIGFEDQNRNVISVGSGKGMKLGRKEKASDFMDALKMETGIEEVEPLNLPTGSGSNSNPISPSGNQIGERKQSILTSPVKMEPIHVSVEEKISVSIHRDGGLEAMEVKGELSLRSSDKDKLQLKLKVVSTNDKSFQFKTHPNIDKKLYQTDSIIALKDSSRSFPCDQNTGVLKWRYVAQDDSEIPLLINCWPSDTGNGNFDVNIEYELQNKQLVLKNTIIAITIPSMKAPVIGDIVGDYDYNRPNRILEWKVPVIDEANPEGSLEFTVSDVSNADGFFPVKTYFKSEKTLAQVDVLEVSQVDSGQSVSFSKEIYLVPEEYMVI